MNARRALCADMGGRTAPWRSRQTCTDGQVKPRPGPAEPPGDVAAPAAIGTGPLWSTRPATLPGEDDS